MTTERYELPLNEEMRRVYGADLALAQLRALVPLMCRVAITAVGNAMERGTPDDRAAFEADLIEQIVESGIFQPLSTGGPSMADERALPENDDEYSLTAEQRIRMRCLELAAESMADVTPDGTANVLGCAKRFADFVLGGGSVEIDSASGLPVERP